MTLNEALKITRDDLPEAIDLLVETYHKERDRKLRKETLLAYQDAVRLDTMHCGWRRFNNWIAGPIAKLKDSVNGNFDICSLL